MFLCLQECIARNVVNNYFQKDSLFYFSLRTQNKMIFDMLMIQSGTDKAAGHRFVRGSICLLSICFVTPKL